MTTQRTDGDGPVALVTGGTGGIGRETARGLAERGFRVAVTGRDRSRGEAAVARLERETGAEVDLHLVEFADLDAVRSFAEDVRDRRDRLDVLVNNAGTWQNERRLVREGLGSSAAAEGVELTFAVNHLAHYLLTRLVLPRLLESAPARIVTVSSELHRRATFDLDAAVGAEGPTGREAYALSKLANVLFTYELARRLDGTGVTANAVHPGVVPSTGLSRNATLLGRLGFRLVGAIPGVGTDPSDGAATSIRVATAPELADATGEYFVEGGPRRSAGISYDREARRRLWAWSAHAVGLPSELDLGDAGRRVDGEDGFRSDVT
jgi:NAD(P)-dependent dehydrogenase (short-subunit alcohol dehydrogenase family)